MSIALSFLSTVGKKLCSFLVERTFYSKHTLINKLTKPKGPITHIAHGSNKFYFEISPHGFHGRQ